MQAHDYYRGMMKHFEINGAGRFLDGIWLMRKQASIDIGKFDDWLHEQVGEYEKKGQNMEEALTLKYGAAAAAFVKSLL